MVMADVGPRQFSGGMNDYALSYKTVPCHLCVLSVLQKKKPTLIIIAEQTA